MARAKRVLIACCLSLLWTVLCAGLGAFLCVVYALGGVWNGVREAWTGWTMFVRLPWVD